MGRIEQSITDQARSEPQRLLYVIPSLNMQHQSGRDLITLTYWIQNSSLHAEQSLVSWSHVEDLYLLAAFAPPDLRRDVCARVEKKQESNLAHSLYGQNPTESRFKSRSCFLSSVCPADFHPKVIRCNEWQRMLNTKLHSCSINLTESLARGHTSQWTTWWCLNRLRAGVTCSKEHRKKWGYSEGDTTCECVVSSDNTRHMFECPLLAHSFSLDDLLQFSKIVCRTMEDSGLMTRWRRGWNEVVNAFKPPNHCPYNL